MLSIVVTIVSLRLRINPDDWRLEWAQGGHGGDGGAYLRIGAVSLQRRHVVFEGHFFANHDIHLEFERGVGRVTNLDPMAALFEPETLGPAVEMVNQTDVVSIDEYLGVARFHLQT